MCGETPSGEAATTEAVDTRSDNYVGGGEAPKVCAMVGAMHKCREAKGVSVLLLRIEESS